MKNGKMLNEELINETLNLMELLYQKVLINYQKATFKKNRTPDFVKILRGEFKNVNTQALDALSLQFEKL